MTIGLAERARRLRAWARARSEAIEAARATRPSVDAAFVVRSHDQEVAGNLLASAIAYRLFLWLLPLTLLVTAGLGFVQAAGSDRPKALSGDVGLVGAAIKVVADTAEQAERSRWAFLVIALFGLYSAGVAGARTFATVHRLVWAGAPGAHRSGLLSSLAFSGATLLAVVLAAGARLLEGEVLVASAVTVLLAVAYAGLWLGASVLLPHGDAPWTRLLPGAALVGIGIQLLRLLTVYYLSAKIRTASELYGGLGVAATLLLGLYLLGRIIVAGAVLNVALWQRADVGSRTTLRE